jgi:hypothetical protein
MKITIFPKDAEILTGYSASKCRKIIREIKASVSKKKFQLITISEFCYYMGFSEEEVTVALNKKNP